VITIKDPVSQTYTLIAKDYNRWWKVH
jgi:hypothetical protein